MTADPKKAPRNRDQELPPRTGDTMEPRPTPRRRDGERKKNAPLPEEETYERERQDRRPGD